MHWGRCDVQPSMKGKAVTCVTFDHHTIAAQVTLGLNIIFNNHRIVQGLRPQFVPKNRIVNRPLPGVFFYRTNAGSKSKAEEIVRCLSIPSIYRTMGRAIFLRSRAAEIEPQPVLSEAPSISRKEQSNVLGYDFTHYVDLSAIYASCVRWRGLVFCRVLRMCRFTSLRLIGQYNLAWSRGRFPCLGINTTLPHKSPPRVGYVSPIKTSSRKTDQLIENVIQAVLNKGWKV